MGCCGAAPHRGRQRASLLSCSDWKVRSPTPALGYPIGRCPTAEKGAHYERAARLRNHRHCEFSIAGRAKGGADIVIIGSQNDAEASLTLRLPSRWT